MADVTPNPTPALSEQFIEFLKSNGEALKKFLDVAIAFYKLQSTGGDFPTTPVDGPQEWHAGDDVVLKTIGISYDDIEAIEKGYAEAHVKELAIEWLKGFVTGLMMGAH